jgi:choline dehydrogenase-like flavoprotein
MREALKSAIKFAHASSFDGFIEGPADAFAAAVANGTDAALEEYSRARSETIWHPCCTVAMASRSNSAGVLNPDLTVKGTVGLRVVDAAAFVRPSVDSDELLH